MSQTPTSPFERFATRLESLSALGAEERAAILGLGGMIAQVGAGIDLVPPGRQGAYVHFIVEGVIGRFAAFSDGVRQITALHLPGDVVYLYAVVRPGTAPSLQALVTTTLIRVPIQDMAALARTMPSLTEAFWAYCAVDIAVLERWAANLGRRAAMQRMAHLLCEIGLRVEQAGRGERRAFSLPLTQQQLGDALGLTPVHINRTLKGLRGEGLISMTGRDFQIHDWDRLSALGEISHFGARSVCWLGVPLIWGGKAMGVLALQSYSPEHTYNERDQELLTFVSYHIANALQRKQAAASLKHAYAGLERRVTERTRALALANRDLREQIAERERVERRLKYETLHDSLTGLPNRTLLLQRLDHALAQYKEDPQRLFAVLFIDLDRFKVINDSVGHLVGDDLLFQVGGRIRACLKTRDVVARLGGDEFAVLLEGIVDTNKATLIAERIISELQTPFRLGTKEIFTSASIGIALSSPHYRQPEELLRDADAAMYNAKDGGRHRAAMFDDRLRREALSLLDMESDLRHALSRNEFEPFYQPIVELADGHVTGYEALLRWHHPERGLLAPNDFLLIAEECGCAEAIDWQIFEQVCTQAVRLIGTEGFISINVSGRHFRSADLDQRLLALFDQYAVPTRCIRIEVTEHALLENPTQVKQMLQNLRSHGVGIALDDFGTGYSSLSYLHQYPFETLKIDRSFITELPQGDEETQGLALVRAIQVLADSLQMRVIAEGIEEESQRQALLRVGCRYGQGFLFAAPQPARTWLGKDNPLLRT